MASRHILAEYLRATARHVYLLLVGVFGAALTIVGIIAPAYVQIVGFVLLGLGLFGAQYLAWREMRDEREKAAADLVDAQRRWDEREAALLAKFDLREQRKATRESLGDFLAQGEEVRAWIVRAGEPVSYVASGESHFAVFEKPKDKDDESLRGSLERAAEWEEQVASFLAQYLGHSYRARFRSQVGTVEQPAPKLGSTEHSEAWTMLDRRLQVLAAIIKEVGDDLIGA
jgi:hypothetical protein